LFLARMAVRERDTAVRTTLGAGRGALTWNALSEALLLSVGGAVVGLVLAGWGTAGLRHVAADTLPRTSEIGLDATSAGLAVLVAVILGVGASLGPLLRAVTIDAGRAIRESGNRAGGSRRRSRARGGLVMTQVALSMVLLVGAGLLGRSLMALLNSDPGFDAAGTLTARFSLDDVVYPEDSDVLEFHRRLAERVSGLPGVEAAGVSNAVPLGAGGTNQNGVTFVGAPGNTGDAQTDQPLVDVFDVSPGFVRAGGLRLLEGSPFLASAGAPVTRGVLVDDVLARRFYPDGSAVGGRLWIGADTFTIAGVVDQARTYDVHRDDRGQVYRPFEYALPRSAYVALRTTGDPEALVAPLRGLVAELDPSLPLAEVRTLRAVVEASLGGERLNASLVAAFALAALLLASLGLYGVVANSVAVRRGELGVRMAVGADAGQVVSLVVAQGLRLVGWGVALGLAGAALSARFLASLLYGVEPWDPVTYVGVAGLLAAVAGLAAWLPARRAAGIDPAVALRAE
ncbi:MAG TPA: FtsX-like permease family protein, partial [Longimicrobiales bacterium]